MSRYAELHCHSNYSFLDGASYPYELVNRAAELGYEALAITDHNGFYGAARFRIAAAEVGLDWWGGASAASQKGANQKISRL
jgi:error-prone DNA polymerase